MNDEEIGQLLSKIDKKLDKVLRLTTLVAKTLHIVPVNEKEEKEIQLLQRKNAATIQKVQEEIAALENKDDKPDTSLSFTDLLNASESEIYSDVIGDDFDLKGE